MSVPEKVKYIYDDGKEYTNCYLYFHIVEILRHVILCVILSIRRQVQKMEQQLLYIVGILRALLDIL